MTAVATRQSARPGRALTVGGLVTTTVGLFVMKAGGVEMPVVPPAAVLLVLAAAAVLALPRHRWPGVVAILVAAAEAVALVVGGGLAELPDAGAVEVVGTVLRAAGVVVALLGGAMVVRRR